jgi:hypothetical protein
MAKSSGGGASGSGGRSGGSSGSLAVRGSSLGDINGNSQLMSGSGTMADFKNHVDSVATKVIDTVTSSGRIEALRAMDRNAISVNVETAIGRGVRQAYPKLPYYYTTNSRGERAITGVTQSDIRDVARVATNIILQRAGK